MLHSIHDQEPLKNDKFMKEMQIRMLKTEDASVYFEVRLRALQEHPEAFAASYEEEQQLTLDEVTLRLAPGPEHVTLGAFHCEQLIGIATITRSMRIKLRHKATIVSMYVAPEARGLGIGQVLLRKIIDVARAWEGVTDIGLAVTVDNQAARSLYVKEAFKSWGIEPRCLCLEGHYYDVEWMVLHLGEEVS